MRPHNISWFASTRCDGVTTAAAPNQHPAPPSRANMRALPPIISIWAGGPGRTARGWGCRYPGRLRCTTGGAAVRIWCDGVLSGTLWCLRLLQGMEGEPSS